MSRRWRVLVCSALAIGAVVCFGSDAHARERPVFCDPPGITVLPRGAIVGGKLCNGAVGLPVCPLVLSAMLDIADAPGVVSAEPAVVCDEPAVV